MNTVEDFKPGDRVRYVPGYLDGYCGDECEEGTVTSCNHLYVFVKFFEEGCTSAACYPADLIHVDDAKFLHSL